VHQRPNSARLAFLALLGGLGFALAASGQTPPPLPEGPGTVRGQIIHPDGPGWTAGVTVVLYGLSAQGEPGLANTATDAQGRFVFAGVSNAPDMAYLVAAQFREVPFFGPRVQFAPGATETVVEIEVASLTRDTSRVSGREVTVQLEWSGARLAVQEIHRLHLAGDEVLFVDEGEREGAPTAFELTLPEGASDFVPVSAGLADQVEEQDGHVRFWGPLYPGEQELRFQYTIPTGGEETTVSFTAPLGAPAFSLMTTEGGPAFRVDGPNAAASKSDVLDIEQRRFRVERLANLAPGAAVVIEVERPATSSDLTRIRIPAAEAWIESDDARVVANLQLRFDVAGNEQIASATAEPLLRIPLPEGARRVELSAEARDLGARISADGVDLAGPFQPGAQRATVRFQLDTAPEGRQFALRFPLTVETLSVLVADTGIAIESDRLHQRRPFREGTRIYLHREAFHVEAGEEVQIGLRPLSEARLGNTAALAIIFLSVAAAAFALAQPLLAARTAEAGTGPSALTIQREALLQDIRDIDHDFETGKLSEQDHQAMRSALRARAIALLQEERAGASEPVESAERGPAPEGCPGCGEVLRAEWQFCARCGQPLHGEP